MSPEENAFTSQEEIDAMVASSTEIGGETPAPPAPEETAPAPNAPPAAPSAAGGAPGDIAQRLTQLEAAVSKMGQADGQALAQQVQAISSRLEEIIQVLPNTLGYGVRANFTCGSCQTQGLVGTRVSCMQCGTETWIGWWPEAA